MINLSVWSITELETMIMFNEDFDSNFENDTTDAGDGDLTLDEINEMGLHPDLAAVADEFAETINGLAWPMRRQLDEMFGRAMLRSLEIGQVAGRLGVSVAMRF